MKAPHGLMSLQRHRLRNIPIHLVMRTLLAAVVVLHIMNLFAQSAAIAPDSSDAAVQFAHLFTVNAEGKIPTWYSAATLLLCAGLLAVIGFHDSEARYRRRWIVLAVLFMCVSVDEASGLHDEMSGYMHELVPTDGLLRSIWVIPAMVCVAALGLWLLPLLRALPRQTFWLFGLAGATYLGGAVGMEMVGSAFLSANDLNMQTTTYALLATIEELMEMTGVVVFIYALLWHMDLREITLQTGRLLNARRALILAVCVALLMGAGLAGQLATYVLDHGRLLGFVRLFHLDGEGNAAAWFSSMLLLSAAVACFACALAGRPAGRCRMWWILSAVFAIFSVDEFASLHELSIAPLRDLWQTSGVLHFPWVIAGAGVAGAVFVLCVRDLLHLPRRIAVLILASGAIYVSGALGVELVGAWWSSNHGEQNLAYQCIVAGEELLELTGAALFVLTLAVWLKRNPIALRVPVKHSGDASLHLSTHRTRSSQAA